MPAQSAAKDTAGDGIAALLSALAPHADLAPHRSVIATLDWVSVLPNRDAPGYVFLAGAVNGMGVGGGGVSLPGAAARLAGEAAEALAQHTPAVPCDMPGDPRFDALWTDAAVPTRIAARDAATGHPLGIPAAAIFPAHAAERRADAPPRSLGLAAGPEPEAARRAGLLELVERDAVARWWQDGVRPHALDAAAVPAADLARLRAGRVRPTTFLDLAAPWGVPAVAAVSRDPDGAGGWAFGFKAAPDAAEAARGAMLELFQMEIGLDMARARGTATPGDRAALARAALDPALFAALPAAPSGPAAPADFAGLAADLTASGARVVVADLGQHGGLAVAKVLAAGLRPFPGGGPAAPHAPGARAELM